MTNTPLVGDENSGIFSKDYNPFTKNEVAWSTLVIILVIYPFLFPQALLFQALYILIDFVYILTFDWEGLKELWDNQK